MATLAELTTAAEADSDREGDTSVTAYWPVWAKQGIESLWRILIGNFTDLYYESEDITLVGGAASNAWNLTGGAIPNARRLVGVDVNPDTALRRRVRARPFVNRNDGAAGRIWAGVPWADDREYMLQGNSVIIVPYEIAAGRYRSHVRTGPTIPATGPDSIDAVMDEYAEYISDFMARKALGKEESSTAFATERMREILAEIIAAGDRNEADPWVIADVEGDGTGGRL